MTIRIYNSLTKQKEDLVPLNGKNINMYSCGVTVYDECHLGHARSLYIFDLIRRYLVFRGFQVKFVRNITDVDDKIINRAIERKKTSREVSEENIGLYYRDMENLGIDRADIEPKATDDIPDMIKFIEGLIAGGYAYESGGDVYFSVRKFPSYGKLSGQSIEKMLEGVRIEKGANKNDPLDFALWKKSKEGEPFWDSPWGLGRPGWHIECSCMSLKHLKCETIDIHAGGRDLIFPHHENEIAQSEALTRQTFAKYWIHHGLLTINGHKMAKSLGNFITVQDFLKKYQVDELKMFFLFSHYASGIDFSEEKMQEARKALEHFDILFWKTSELLKDQDIKSGKEAEFIRKAIDAFIASMDDDFNTPQALARLFDLIKDTNKFIDQEKANPQYYQTIYSAVHALDELAKGVLGLFRKESAVELSEEESALLEERKNARSKKDFKKSDELRDRLRERGISVEDTKEGQTWRKI